MSGHPIALRTPWYVGARLDPARDRFSDGQRAPEIQKYDRDDFVQTLLADPRASLRFDRRDRWTFTMPRTSVTDHDGLSVRKRLSTRRTVTTGMRKLYQPAHQRFYAVIIELFCAAPGLPRPAPEDDPGVTFVVRRRAPVLGGSAAAGRRLAQVAARELVAADETIDDPVDDDPVDDAVDDAVAAVRHDAAFRAAHADLLAEVTIAHEIQGWYVDGCTGRGRWAPVPAVDLHSSDDDADPDVESQPGPGTGVAPPGGTETELALPMWRIPPAVQDCGRARTRSLWFGAVPTFSGELDPDGAPRFDEHATYVLQCVARRDPTLRPAWCPPEVARSDHSRPYRLAAFFDPAGTAQRPVRITLPDMRALEGHVGSGAARPNVTFETPPGSQLPAPPFGAIPSSPKTPSTGGAAEFCSFSIELITIVAMFVLKLFLPVVVLLFGLWWMLLLRFCWPRADSIAALLDALNADFSGLPDGELKTLADVLGVDQDDRRKVADLLDAPGALDKLTSAQRKELVEELAPEAPPGPPPASLPTSRPPDPLC